MTIQSLSEAPLASLRQSQRLPHHQPHPQPQPHPHTRPCMLVGARTVTRPQRHTDTNTHKHTLPPRWVKSQKPQVSEMEKERERGIKRTTQASHPLTSTQSTLHSEYPPGPPPSTRPHPRPPTHSHTHSHSLTLWPGDGVWVLPKVAKLKGTFETLAVKKSWGLYG